MTAQKDGFTYVRVTLSEYVVSMEINRTVVGPGPGTWETEQGSGR